MIINYCLNIHGIPCLHKVHCHVKYTILKLNFLQNVIHMWLISDTISNHMQRSEGVKNFQTAETDTLL
jgi:hypothetical protein